MVKLFLRLLAAWLVAAVIMLITAVVLMFGSACVDKKTWDKAQAECPKCECIDSWRDIE